MPINFNYNYYDTPEGQDIYLKTFALSKYAAVAGLGIATYDVLMYSHPQGIVNTAGRYLYITGPLIGMAAAFAATTNIAQNIRGKNDKLNYFLGGAVSGAIFGAWQKSVAIGVPAAVLLGFVAVTKKMSVDDGWKFFPEIKHSSQNAVSARHDWTFVKDLPKNWTTGEC